MSRVRQTQKVFTLSSSRSVPDLAQENALPPTLGVKESDLELGRVDPTATLVRIPTVMSITGIGRATVYKLMSQPESGFPQPVKLTDSDARGAPVAWVLSEVLNWTRARIAARDKAAA
ncbi:AlpA family phage regulatory protein [Pseudomonas sp. BC115LW]|nr:AlpA family phage regulatory protein [Pseudomonas sp. BC115LW]